MTAHNFFWDGDWFSPQASQDQNLIAQLDFVPGLRELLFIRQAHALEHGTVWVLTELAERYPTAWRHHYAELSGMSTGQGFIYLVAWIKPIFTGRSVQPAIASGLGNGI